ncbi:hypothetical protein ACFVVQ_25030 [Paenibacillus chitinolyticus]|uniref:hypothetical protein n=1 Tax=Paenibacillus chitinolyticus TaxID=79263 RepID=UPI0036DB3435
MLRWRAKQWFYYGWLLVSVCLTVYLYVQYGRHYEAVNDEFPLFNALLVGGLYIPLLFVIFYGILMHILFKLVKHGYGRMLLLALLLISVFVYSMTLLESSFTVRFLTAGASIGFAYFFITTFLIDPTWRIR